MRSDPDPVFKIWSDPDQVIKLDQIQIRIWADSSKIELFFSIAIEERKIQFQNINFIDFHVERKKEKLN